MSKITTREKILATLIVLSLVAWFCDRDRLEHQQKTIQRYAETSNTNLRRRVLSLRKTLEHAKRTGTIEGQPVIGSVGGNRGKTGSTSVGESKE